MTLTKEGEFTWKYTKEKKEQVVRRAPMPWTATRWRWSRPRAA